MLARRFPAGVALLLVLALPWLSGCDDAALNAPDIQDDLFSSYVAIGNSITAGFQSGGINSATQAESYAVLLANQMNTPFGVPELAAPGCPPPFASIPPQPPTTPCALRSNSAAAINNVAVPGANLFDVLSNVDPNSPDLPPGPNALTQFILGGRTQLEAALDADPTFASVWIGSGDVLSAVNAGTVALAPSVSDFEADYRALTTGLQEAPSLSGAVLIGAVDATAAPGVFPGEVYLGLTQQLGSQLPSNFSVAPSCLPNTAGGQGTTTEISFLFVLDLLSQAIQNPGQSYAVGCDAGDPGALTPAERDAISARAAAYNDVISGVAQENGWAFFDPNDALAALIAAGEIPPIPNFGSAQPFGNFLSLDGIHPSAITHQVVADQLVQLINQRYETNLPRLDDAPSLPSGGGQ